jgi:hypothetical protein
MPEFIAAWANAIAQFEGFNQAGSRPARNHNPGDLKYAGQVGAVGKDSGGFAIFADDVTGFQALYNQLAKYVQDFPGYSILEMMAHYLGQSTPGVDGQGSAYQYADYVASALGVDRSVTLAELANPAAPVVAADPGAPPDTSGGTGSGPSGGEMAGLAIVGLLLLWVASRAWG